MSHKFAKLIDVIGALEVALEKAEWEEIATLDQLVKSIVVDYTSVALEGEEKRQLGELLKTLQELYDRIATENMGRKTALGVELKKLHKERNAISQYIQSSGY